MANLAHAIKVDDVKQHAGTVVAVEPGGLRVRTADGAERVARRAVSCLVAPLTDDRVLVAVGPGVCHVLAVLERTAGTAVTLTVDGDMEIRTADGRFTVAAQRGIDLISAETVSVAAHALDVNAHEGTVTMGTLAYVGEKLKAEVDRVKLFAVRMDTAFDRLVQRARNVYRTVDEIDQLKAGTVDYAVKGAMSLHAANAVVTAENLVKVDGEQIHMG